MTILSEPGNYRYRFRAIAFIHHPVKGDIAADVVLNNDGTPLGRRIRELVATVLGADWQVVEWYPAEGEF